MKVRNAILLFHFKIISFYFPALNKYDIPLEIRSLLLTSLFLTTSTTISQPIVFWSLIFIFLQSSPCSGLFPVNLFSTHQPQKMLFKCYVGYHLVKTLQTPPNSLRIQSKNLWWPYMITWHLFAPLLDRVPLPPYSSWAFLLFLEYSKYPPISEPVNLLLFQPSMHFP